MSVWTGRTIFTQVFTGSVVLVAWLCRVHGEAGVVHLLSPVDGEETGELRGDPKAEKLGDHGRRTVIVTVGHILVDELCDVAQQRVEAPGIPSSWRLGQDILQAHGRVALLALRMQWQIQVSTLVHLVGPVVGDEAVELLPVVPQLRIFGDQLVPVEGQQLLLLGARLDHVVLLPEHHAVGHLLLSGHQLLVVSGHDLTEELEPPGAVHVRMPGSIGPGSTCNSIVRKVEGNTSKRTVSRFIPGREIFRIFDMIEKSSV